MVKFFIVCAIFIVTLVVNQQVHKALARIGQNRNVNVSRIFYIQKVVQFFIVALAVVLVVSLFGVRLSDVGLILSSLFAVIGVALFAQWSILSNLTASVIIFFFSPYRVGNFVCFVEGDQRFEGKIMEISLFHIVICQQDGNTLTYPNNLVFQKPVIIYANGCENRETVPVVKEPVVTESVKTELSGM